jgi:catechol 2,3-dioxygenase-like lactoylglutathione lyase family enzyme
MITPKLDLIGIATSDIHRSVAFYRDLGIEIADPNNETHHEVTLSNGLRLAWDTVETITSFVRDFAPTTGDMKVALAFLFDSPDDVDQAYARVTELGTGRCEPWDAPWGQRYAVVQDPDGNTVDLFAPITGSDI